MDTGIYSITSPSGKKYIGATVSFKKRWREHKSQMKKGTHHSAALQRAYKKYGISGFIFEKVIICDRSCLSLYEQIAMKCMNNDYNMSKTGGWVPGHKHSAESLKKMSLSKSGGNHPCAVKVLCVETGEIFETINSAADWLKSIGNKYASPQSISNVVTGRAKIAYGYRWKRV